MILAARGFVSRNASERSTSKGTVRVFFFLRWRSVMCNATFQHAAGRTGRTSALSEAERNRKQSKTENLVSGLCARSCRMRSRVLPHPIDEAEEGQQELGRLKRLFHLLLPN